MDKKKLKILRIDQELHRKLKAEAGKRGITLQELVEEKLNKK